MNSQKLIRRATGTAMIAAGPLCFALAGPAPASANPDLCVTGPYGYASACIEVPGVQIVYDDGPRGKGKGHWKHGHWH
ncbi:hypothetical protein MCNF_04480 [Mycolicibacterium confluentis]|uniref:DUF3761 domain-containing protein n=1 Tax=Mycolicibacterium confluentis TaxID=28047 RepID=A0A7I7XRZ6_9MYCO|nr:hypothetical protein MCNF_04480 [Mycolicibacterium confluentis]